MKPKLFFAGTLSADPEVRFSKTGNPFASFTLESKSNGDQYPNRVRVMVNADKATGLLQGTCVLVEGDAKAEAYLGKTDGKPKASLSCWANSITVLETGGVAGPELVQGLRQAVAQVGAAKRTVPPPGSPAEEPDSLPF